MNDTRGKATGIGPELGRLMMGDEAFDRQRRKSKVDRAIAVSVVLALSALCWLIVGFLVVLLVKVAR